MSAGITNTPANEYGIQSLTDAPKNWTKSADPRWEHLYKMSTFVVHCFGVQVPIPLLATNKYSRHLQVLR